MADGQWIWSSEDVAIEQFPFIISRRPIGPVREIIKCPVSVRACVRASVRHVFTKAFLSLKILYLELPNLQDNFVIGKTCLGIFFWLIRKNKMAATGVNKMAALVFFSGVLPWVFFSLI